jgi:rhamnosyltransferase subunit B
MQVLLVTKGSSGDVIPFIALGIALRQRGHSVVLISNCHYRLMAIRAGLGFDSWDTPQEFELFINDTGMLDSPQGIGAFCEKHIFPYILREFSLLRKHVAGKRTILVTRHMGSFASQFLSEHLKIPLISVFTAVAQMECVQVLGDFYAHALAPQINLSRRLLGLDPIRDWHSWIMSSRFFLACWPAWFAISTTIPHDSLVHIGFLQANEVETGTIPPELTTIDGLILITGGTASWSRARQFYEVAMNACDRIGRPAILVCKNRDFIPEPLARNTLHYFELPFASLMPHLSAVIHHAGTSILVRAMLAGIPQIALPFGGDRPDTASRLTNLGVCITVPINRWHPHTVAEALHQILQSESISRACARMRLRVEHDNPDLLLDGCVAIEHAAE